MNGSVPSAIREILVSVLRRRRRELLLFTAWSALEALPAFLSGRLVARAIDTGFLADRPLTGFGWLAVLGGAALVGAAGTRGTYRQLAAVVEPFRDELAGLAVEGALRRSTRSGARADTAGVARLTRQVEIVRDTFGSLLMVAQEFLITTVAALLGLLTLLPAALVVVLPPLVVGIAVFVGALVAAMSRQRGAVVAEERVAEHAGALADSLRDVVACGGERTARENAGRCIDAQAAADWDVARFTATRTAALAIGGWVPLFSVLAATPWLVGRGASTGAVLGVLVYVLQGLLPAVQALVRNVGHTGLWFVVVLGRVLESAQTSSAAGRDAGTVEDSEGVRPRGNEVRLRGVTFDYGAGDPVVRDLDATIADGEHLAVVGPSGAGKSTLAGLVTGVLRPGAGRVLIGGARVRPPASPERERVLIPQESYVFAGTLEENLTYLNPGAVRTELDRACRAVGLTPLVTDLGGYGAQVEPRELSAGQRQLIALTRAYLSPAGLVVLDEATCHLDPLAEAHAEHAFSRRGGTLVVVAHRISSALRAERILVMDGARVTLGTHEQLLGTCGLYRDLIGHWHTASEPAGLPRHPDRLDAVAGPGLPDDRGHVVADGADRQEQLGGDLGHG